MAIYDYRAVDASGKISLGRMPAQNERELENRLRNNGLETISISPRRTDARALRSGSVPRKELINFCFHMEQTLRGGVMLPDALTDLIDGVTHASFRDTLTVILEAVREGSPLSRAMREFPGTFDEVFTGLVFAGETSGQLPEAFARVGARLRWIDELNAQVKKMVSYPAFTLAVLVGVSLFMLMFLVPQLAGFIKEMTGGELPVQTRVLLFVSASLRAYWPALLAVPVGLAAGGWLVWRSLGEKALTRIDRMLLRLPVIGTVFEKIILARFTSLFGLMYASGIPVLQALLVCRDAAGNRWIAAGIQRVHDEVVQGRPLTDAFAHVALFPSLVLRMVRIGEATGELDKALENVAYFFNREIQERIDRIQAMVEPALTVTLGLLLGWLMLAVLGPIYDILGKIKI
ncbi:MAG: type II secretion system F family protein [Lautropia sp.]